MGQKQSKDRSLYQHVVNGNIQAIHALSAQGASLEWKDKEGRTPLIMAAKDPRLYGVAKTLIELGANVNAFSRAHQGGTPLHYAAKEGIHSTVALLLSHGANAFVKNRDDKTPLDIARKNGRSLVVREIESRICYFAGHISKTFGPGFSDASSPQCSKSWVVVVPREPHSPPKPPKLELVIYTNPQDDKPRNIISPKSAKIKEPKFDQPNPVLIIKDKRKKTRYKFSAVTAGDKQQLRRLYNACKGISQVMPVSSPIHTEALGTPIQATTANANTQPIPFTSRNSFDYTIGSPIPSPSIIPRSSIWINEPQGVQYRGPEPWTPPNQSPQIVNQANFQAAVPVPVQLSDRTLPAVASPSPSAPPASPDELFISDDVSTAATPSMPVAAEDRLNSSLCVICWDARVEGACVPCGHVSSCMACLQEIKAKNGVCPVCRSEIHQVVKLYGI